MLTSFSSLPLILKKSSFAIILLPTLLCIYIYSGMNTFTVLMGPSRYYQNGQSKVLQNVYSF